MSKNILKESQKRRKKKQSKREGQDSSNDDPIRDALLNTEAKNEQPTKRLNAEIPSRLHQRFKAACKAEDVSMTTALTQLVETYVELKG
jgi:hypothetical protein